METPQTTAVMPGLTVAESANCEFLVRVDVFEGSVFTNYDSARRYAKGARFALDCIPYGRGTTVSIAAINLSGVEIKRENIW